MFDVSEAFGVIGTTVKQPKRQTEVRSCRIWCAIQGNLGLIMNAIHFPRSILFSAV